VSAPDACPHRPPCPGCPRFGASALPERALTRIRTLARQADLPEPPIHQAPTRGHRHRARLAVRGRPGNPRIGLFQAGSHRIVAIPHCPIHHPLLNESAHEIREAIRETGVEPYADASHRGAIRYVQLVVERSSERVQVVLVGRGSTPDVLGGLPEAVERRLGERLQGLFFNGQPERSNTILGPTWVQLAGEDPCVREHWDGVDVFFPPGAFGQSHLPLFDRARRRIAELTPPDLCVAELYCGVGAIGLGLLGRTRELRFNERSPDGLAGLECGLAARPDPEQRRAKVLPGAAGDRLDAIRGADVVIVDPPRKGLDPVLRQALVREPPRRLVYLACGLEALFRDLEVLRDSGSLALAGIEIFDFFPFTEHVETLVWLDRVEEQSGLRDERSETP
jgi:tRNA/tmRNA/rRNA uracil-C5-methylase (TrmA/RlmC/RlmD family)